MLTCSKETFRIIFPFDAFFPFFFLPPPTSAVTKFFMSFRVLDFYWESTFYLALMMLLKSKT